MSLKMEWNRDKTSMVLLSKIKEVTITVTASGQYKVQGWYNKENAFTFGSDFNTLNQAQKYVGELKKKMRMGWNRKQTAAVVLNRLKEYTVQENAEGKFTVRGWFNKENSFLFGDDFETLTMAQTFLNDINDRF